MQKLPDIGRRAEGKIPTTKVTNELRDAIVGLAPIIQTGMVVTPFGGASNLFVVRLTEDGGDEGDNSTPCSFTYTVMQLDNVTVLAEEVSLVHVRANGRRIAGTYGLAFTDQDGTLKLFDAGERLGTGGCE